MNVASLEKDADDQEEGEESNESAAAGWVAGLALAVIVTAVALSAASLMAAY